MDVLVFYMNDIGDTDDGIAKDRYSKCGNTEEDFERWKGLTEGSR